MKELETLIEQAQAYINAVDRGFQNFIKLLPELTSQRLKILAQRKLDTTRETYIDAIQSNMENYVLVVSLDPDNWLANAVESGVDSFNLKEGHLRSPKALVSKSGFRYMHIPLGKSKSGGPASDSPKSQDFQARIRATLQKPMFKQARIKVNIDGSVSKLEEVQTPDPDLQGLYRIMSWTQSLDYTAGKRGITRYIMFRTMSERPGTSVWQHPGIQPANLFRELRQFVTTGAEPLLKDLIDKEIEKVKPSR